MSNCLVQLRSNWAKASRLQEELEELEEGIEGAYIEVCVEYSSIDADYLDLEEKSEALRKAALVDEKRKLSIKKELSEIEANNRWLATQLTSQELELL